MSWNQFQVKQNLSKDIVNVIKGLILEGELNPGDRIVETKIAKELGISQTPIREALHRLAGEGIITILPNKGAQVRSFTAQDVFEVYSTRAALEGVAIRFAVYYATDEDILHLIKHIHSMEEKVSDSFVKSLSQDSAYIHDFIYNLSHHTRIKELYKSISFQISMLNRMLGQKYTKQQEVEEHRELIDAIKQGDPNLAELTMREHIRRSYIKIMGLYDYEDSNYWIHKWI